MPPIAELLTALLGCDVGLDAIDDVVSAVVEGEFAASVAVADCVGEALLGYTH